MTVAGCFLKTVMSRLKACTWSFGVLWASTFQVMWGIMQFVCDAVDLVIACRFNSNRFQIGHYHPTHSNLLSGDDLPSCESCRLPLTVKHILVECTKLYNVPTSAKNISQSLPLESCLKAMIIMLFLILSKKLIFTTNCNFCYFCFILAL